MTPKPQPVAMFAFALLVLLGTIFREVEGLNYTKEETEVINKFRELMGAELYQDYMKSDDFLITWLRTQNMDLQGAQAMLRRHLTWRKDNKIDTIMKEDFDTFPKMFEITTAGVDKQGRPLFIVYYGAWGVRRVVLAGMGNKYQRYLAQQLENASINIREVNATSEAHNITQVLFIMDGNGYNLRQHACIQCIPQYIAFLNLLESNYPYIAHKMVLINVPRVAGAILEIVRPLLHPQTRKRFYVYGPDRDEWRKVLLELVDVDQLPARLGGTAP